MPPQLALPRKGAGPKWGCPCVWGSCPCPPAPAPMQAYGPAILLDVKNMSPLQARESH